MINLVSIVKVSKKLFFITMLLILSGCVAQTLKPEHVSQIKNIGVISMLPVDFKYEKIGITVFNNEFLAKPVGEKFNIAASNKLQELLAVKDKTRTFAKLPLSKEVSDKFYSHSLVVSSSTERIQNELIDLAKKNNLDTIIIISEVFDHDQSRRGVEMYFSAGFGSVRSATLKSDMVIYVVDREGKALAAVGSNVQGKSVSPIVNKDWSYELASNISETEHLRLVDEMVLLISSEIGSMVNKLGLN